MAEQSEQSASAVKALSIKMAENLDHKHHVAAKDVQIRERLHSPSDPTAQEQDTGNLSRASAEPVYPGVRQRIVVFVALLLATFLTALDRTIIGTAIPQITNEFHSFDNIGWYSSAFMLTCSACQLLFGRIYTFYSPKIVYLVAIAVFETGSLICGTAPDSIALIIGRAIAGIGAAGIQAGSVIIVVSLISLPQRPTYMGLFTAVFGLASVIGPLLGGVFTTDVSWRWCFYINLPIGGLAWLIMLFVLPPTAPAQPDLSLHDRFAQLDLLGELFLLPSIICLLLALQWGGGVQYSWSNGRVIALLVIFGVTLIAFIAVQILQNIASTIPLRLLNRNMVAGMFFTFCITSGMMIFAYFLPVWFQAIKGTSAVHSGIDIVPLVLSIVVGSLVAGISTTRTGYYTPAAIASSVLMPIGAGLITTFTPASAADSGTWIGYQILLGFGIGTGYLQGNVAAQTVLAEEDVPTGVALMFFCQQLGSAIFVSVGQNILLSRLVHGIPGFDPAQVGATALRQMVPTQDLGTLLAVYNNALRQVFIVGLILSCLSALGSFTLEWRSVKGLQGPSQKESRDGDGERKDQKNVKSG